ncbi:protein of unknown function [Streptococcus thermophilus]|uniref:Uncharacterized protein n=1 Tax=Streptococcus thermophilus TaxID=1308 RepID=A0A8D6UDU5_STRTR|nr:hypothetical protein STH02_16570 [Streptococcus thermophilus]CAD0121829.1 protein of unknown function [Streptococcus thermophilus]CAD0152317.1 protein of unknown function [Streptococcus thermophilus]
MMKKKAVKRHDALPFLLVVMVVILIVIIYKMLNHYSINPVEMFGEGRESKLIILIYYKLS